MEQPHDVGAIKDQTRHVGAVDAQDAADDRNRLVLHRYDTVRGQIESDAVWTGNLVGIVDRLVKRARADAGGGRHGEGVGSGLA
ncbi:hypothetical protein [Pseudofulvimonas gallinarii]|uniref:hypothetical protein n=1 Tax=Pseudofulvimonas gallinarii TaxID=634155 RepID=UPI000F4715BF|nr:hypothetical protein [Pseudofulvimonas gallinarii]